MSVVLEVATTVTIGEDRLMVAHLHIMTVARPVFRNQVILRHQDALMCHHREMIMRMPILWNTDQFGRIMGTCLHDAGLTGICFSEGHMLKLQVQNTSGEMIEIEFLGVVDINIAQLCNGAIIFDVYLWKVNHLVTTLRVVMP